MVGWVTGNERTDKSQPKGALSSLGFRIHILAYLYLILEKMESCILYVGKPALENWAMEFCRMNYCKPVSINKDPE